MIYILCIKAKKTHTAELYENCLFIIWYFYGQINSTSKAPSLSVLRRKGREIGVLRYEIEIYWSVLIKILICFSFNNDSSLPSRTQQATTWLQIFRTLKLTARRARSRSHQKDFVFNSTMLLTWIFPPTSSTSHSSAFFVWCSLQVIVAAAWWWMLHFYDNERMWSSSEGNWWASQRAVLWISRAHYIGGFGEDWRKIVIIIIKSHESNIKIAFLCVMINEFNSRLLLCISNSRTPL